MLFKSAKGIVPNSLPNYTIRWFDKNFIKISLRVLRRKSNREVVTKLENSIAELLRKERAKNIVVNPQGEDAKISGWSSAELRKCKAYNRLSEFVVKLAEESLFQPNDRNEMRHLAINMLFMREAAKRGEWYAFFVDAVSGNIFPQPFPTHVYIKTQPEREE